MRDVVAHSSFAQLQMAFVAAVAVDGAEMTRSALEIVVAGQICVQMVLVLAEAVLEMEMAAALAIAA